MEKTILLVARRMVIVAVEVETGGVTRGVIGLVEWAEYSCCVKTLVTLDPIYAIMGVHRFLTLLIPWSALLSSSRGFPFSIAYEYITRTGNRHTTLDGVYIPIAL